MVNVIAGAVYRDRQFVTGDERHPDIVYMSPVPLTQEELLRDPACRTAVLRGLSRRRIDLERQLERTKQLERLFSKEA